MTTLRDYKHANKIFRSNNYQKTPKAKFLFHVSFTINSAALPPGLTPNENYGVYVKNVKLPSYTFQTAQLNQYNRKRIIQTKIKYDPVTITFHDDNASVITQLWNSYYIYYYRDGSKPQVVFKGARGGRPTTPSPGFNPLYNSRTQYISTVEGDYDWGYIGEPSNLKELNAKNSEPVKVPFFKEITIFSFYQHTWTAYTLVNPLITSFAHDTHSYDEGTGVMTNNMSLDYETVVYNYGALDGNDPSNIVTGFGTQETYDRTPSPNTTNLSNLQNIATPQGLLNTVGGSLLGAIYQGRSLTQGAQEYATAGQKTKDVSTGNNLALDEEGTEISGQFPALSPMTSPTRNALFAFPVAGITPSLLGTANALPTGTITAPTIISEQTVAGKQINNLNQIQPFGS